MPRTNFDRIIVWFRRDLRVEDNGALYEACASAKEIIPLFVVDDLILNRPDTSAARVAFLADALSVLDRNLRQLGGRLIVRHGETTKSVVRAVREFSAKAVFFHEEYEPFGRRRDDKVKTELAAETCEVRSFPGIALVEPTHLLSQSGSPYTVFTPYKRAWFDFPSNAPLPAPKLISVPESIVSDPIPTIETLKIRPTQNFATGGEDAAVVLLQNFVDNGIADYAVRRDFPGVSGTSKLSSHLHCGTVSPRSVLQRVRGLAGADVFLSEIGWRDFYKQILYHHPYVENGAFRRQFDSVRWENDESLFRAWCEGKTGYPIVDAGMRQLRQEAWMHNRVRMIVASFLTKDLLIDWRCGEQYFMQQLVDGDLASNNGGWQWAAGTGTDAQPFFRIFNPVLQGERFDPDGDYVKKYAPELKRLPKAFVHAPWKLSAAEQSACGCVLGKDYPSPIVIHAEQRTKVLAMYRKAGE
jgi:deoxyribodipyrimidine photo-lyase